MCLCLYYNTAKSLVKGDSKIEIVNGFYVNINSFCVGLHFNINREHGIMFNYSNPTVN